VQNVRARGAEVSVHPMRRIREAVADALEYPLRIHINFMDVFRFDESRDSGRGQSVHAKSLLVCFKSLSVHGLAIIAGRSPQVFRIIEGQTFYQSPISLLVLFLLTEMAPCTIRNRQRERGK
jgi:hypothetical protein